MQNHKSFFKNVPLRFIVLSLLRNSSISILCEVFRVLTCDFNDVTSRCRASIWLSKVFGSFNNNRRSIVRSSLSSLRQFVVRHIHVKMTDQVFMIVLKTCCFCDLVFAPIPISLSAHLFILSTVTRTGISKKDNLSFR